MSSSRALHGWSLRDLSERCGVAAGHLSRIENGHRPPTAAIAEALDHVFPERNGWFSDWYLESLAWNEVPAGFRSWAEFEEATRHLHSWTPGIIDGLLQVEPYSTALMATVPGVSGEQVRDRVAGRMERQRRVLDREDPPSARFVVDEVSLYRLLGSPEVMAAQMRHMLEAAALERMHEQWETGASQRIPTLPAGQCVEVASAEGVMIRDTANRDGLTLTVSTSAWRAFLAAIR